MKPAIYVWNNMGLGDNMFISPFLKKLSNIYNQKITFFIPNWKVEPIKEFYKNNPHVEEFIIVGDTHGEDSWDALLEKYEKFFVFNNTVNEFYYSDLRQLAASSAGITLKEEELSLVYYPDEYINIEGLPEKFVCINPYLSFIDRDWPKERWQHLVNKLNEDGIYVVAIGKGKEDIDYFNLDIKLGVNLCNKECQNNLSQTWHIINKSDFFISFDCGIFTLAGSTNTHIIQLGWCGNPYNHMPIRNGVRGYKYDNVRGDCKIYCLTDPEIDYQMFGTIKKKLGVDNCFLNLDWKCKPEAEQVYLKIKELYEKN
jgi:ADP-heptose:LPS heptosyltransferase